MKLIAAIILLILLVICGEKILKEELHNAYIKGLMQNPMSSTDSLNAEDNYVFVYRYPKVTIYKIEE